MAFKSFYMTTKVTWGFVSGRKEDFNTVHTRRKGRYTQEQTTNEEAGLLKTKNANLFESDPW
jgi:hypothetical protein